MRPPLIGIPPFQSPQVAWSRTWWRPNSSTTSRVIVAVFGLGLLLRLLVMTFYSDVVLNYYGGDSTRYLRLPFTGYRNLFSDPNIPAGYPAFLKVMHLISRSIVVTIGVQHVMGLITAVLLLLLVRQIGVPLWLGIIPAGVVLLSGDFLFLETALLTETLWMLLITAGLCAAMFARKSTCPRRWLAGVGLLLALAAIVRHLALPLAIPVAIWAGWELGQRWRDRLGFACTVLGPAAIIVFLYVGVARLEHGYAGFTDMSGFNLYGRIGQFADCHDFSPPTGTAALCNDPVPKDKRGGTFYYTFDPSSPLYRAGFVADPQNSAKLARFAHAVILHQPIDYIMTIGKDLLRYVAPSAVVARPQSGVGPTGMSFASPVAANQGQEPSTLADEYSEVYSDVSRSMPGQGVRIMLGTYQEIFRLSGLLVVLLALLSIVGMIRSRGIVRRAIWLFSTLAFYLYLAPVALSSYDVRYGVPAGLILSLSGTLGGWAIFLRMKLD